MLPEDNGAAARRASKMFRDGRVEQFYDANQRCGLTYSRDVFTELFDQAMKALPKNDRIREALEEHNAKSPSERAVFDAAFFYKPGVEWRRKAPAPSRWLMQVKFFGTEARRGKTGRFMKNRPAARPVESDWFVELRGSMNALLGRERVRG